MVFDGGTNRLLVAVGRGGIDQPVTDVDRVADATLAFRGIGHLKHPEPEDRHLDAIVQSDAGNVAGHDHASLFGSAIHELLMRSRIALAMNFNPRQGVGDARQILIGECEIGTA